MKTKLMTMLAVILGALPVLAQEAATATEATGGKSGLAAIAAAIAISVAALGGGLGQGRAAASALDGIARNPAANNKIFLSMILSLVFIESLVIYALVIAFRLV